MRPTASILHLDLDAFFASVEQRDKPSLRGKPVIVGGIGQRGVVSTASYEARVFGVRSAMSMAEARSRCPHAAFLSGRFDAYREASGLVMGLLRDLSPAVEPLSLDEAFVDLAAGEDFDPESVPELVERLRKDVTEVTEGLTASVGVATSKLMAKIATEIDKPDGSFIVAPGTERDLLAPMPVTVIAGVGPATAARLQHVGITRVGDVWKHSEAELVDLLGQASGASLHRLSRGLDDRTVSSHRENKSVSTEDTFETDIVDRGELGLICDALARKTAERLRKAGLSGRTVTLKVRYHDFSTHTRSLTLKGPTDQPRVIMETARRLLDATDTGGGLRLLGVGVSGLADWVQDDLFATEADETPEPLDERPRIPTDPPREHEWSPGQDVHHAQHGDGWVWGRGLGLVTVRFETRHTPVGPVRTLRADDPDLVRGHRASPSHPAGTVEE